MRPRRADTTDYITIGESKKQQKSTPSSDDCDHVSGAPPRTVLELESLCVPWHAMTPAKYIQNEERAYSRLHKACSGHLLKLADEWLNRGIGSDWRGQDVEGHAECCTNG